MRLRTLLMVAALAAPIAGCKAMLYKQTGNVMGSYATDVMLPDLMTNADTDIACETGVSFAAFLMSFGRVTDAPNKAGLATYLSAGTCAEETAWEAELRQLRALVEGRAGEAKDARIAEQRAHARAARRFFRAYEMMQDEFGPVGEDCPDLAEDDEVLYLLGLSSGVLAVLHDRSSNGSANVPLDIPPAVARAAKCLDSTKWWGVPQALRGAIASSVPGVNTDEDPWKLMADAAAQGEKSGVRLARAFQAQAAATAGKDNVLHEAIRAHARSQAKVDSDWRMLDSLGTLMIRHESDKIWTRELGHRTPMGAFGTFPGERNESPDAHLLDGIE